MKGLFRWLGVFALLVSFGMTGYSAGVTDLLDLCTGKNNSNCPFRVDANGNVTTLGTVTVSGSGSSTFTGPVSQPQVTTTGVTIYTPQSTTAVSTNTTLSPTATFVNLLSTGAYVTLGLGTIPAISTTTATNGQLLILNSTSTVSYVQISTGTTACVVGPTATISTSNKAVSLIFDSAAGLWKQIQQ